jgi:protein SCO1/2
MKFCEMLILAALAWALAGCREKAVDPAAASVAPVATVTNAPATTNAPPPPVPNAKSYLVRGVIKKIEPEKKSITIQHEDIPDLMEGMTMPFNVRDLKLLDGLQPGDTVWFRLWVAPNESWVDKLKKEQGATPQPEARVSEEREPIRVARDVEPLKLGDPMPNYHFTNELGQGADLNDFRGQALAFTFIFTRCPLPEFCPRMSRNFTEVCEKLKGLPNGPTNWHLLTITFDPTFDTPSVLKGYSQAFQNDPAHWNFVTGSMIDTDAITDQFELIIIKRGTEWDHKVRTVVVDSNGKVQTIIYGNEWKPDALVQEIVKAAKVPRSA